MIASEFSILFLFLPFISLLSDEVDAFVMEGGQWQRRRLTFQSSRLFSSSQPEDSESPLPTIQFNLTSLLCADNAQRIHLQQLYQDAISIMQPPTEQNSAELATPTSSALDPFRRFLRPYSKEEDVKYHGHFAIPPSPYAMSDDDQKTTVPPNLAFAMDGLLDFLPKHLSTTSKDTTTINSNKETVVMLSNMHESLPVSWQQVEYISKVLTVEGNTPSVSLLHVGTSCNLGDDDSSIQMTLTHDTLQALKSLNLILVPQSLTAGEEVCIQKKDMDLLQAVCASSTSQEDDSAVESLVKLIDRAVASPQPRLVLMCSSIQSFYVASAIEEWKDLATSAPLRPQLQHFELTDREAEELLHEKLTVVTVGSLTDFPVGPAYIHVSMYDDVISDSIKDQGKKGEKTSKNSPVVLQAISPYPSASPDRQKWSTSSLYSSDAHNMLVCAIQFLHLVLRINGLSSLREVYDQGSQPTPELDVSQSQFNINYAASAKGLLALPQDEILLAVLQAMGVGQWLWNPQDEYDEDIIDEVLPEIDYAKATVEEYFGYDVYEELQAMVEAR